MWPIFTFRPVIDHQAEVNDSHLVVTRAYHEVIRLHISMQVKRLVELLQTIKGQQSYLFQCEFPLKMLEVDVILDGAIKVLEHDVSLAAVVKSVSIILWNAL